jgi:hypothetical protein
VVYAAVPLALGTFYPLPAARGGAAAAAWLAVLKLCIQVGGWLVCGGACGLPLADSVVNGWAADVSQTPLPCLPLPLALRTAHPHLPFSLIARPALQETIEKTHYSVDMFLAVVLTALVWHWRSSSYSAAAVWPRRGPGAPWDPLPKGLVALVLGVLVIVFVGVAGT